MEGKGGLALIKTVVTASKRPFKNYTNGESLGEKEVIKVEEGQTNTRKGTKDGLTGTDKGSKDGSGHK